MKNKPPHVICLGPGEKAPKRTKRKEWKEHDGKKRLLISKRYWSNSSDKREGSGRES